MNWKPISEYPYYHLPQEKQPRVLIYAKHTWYDCMLRRKHPKCNDTSKKYCHCVGCGEEWIRLSDNQSISPHYGFEPTHFMEIEEPCTTA